ncbi:AmmeMemoRadiSam system protein A [Paradesulfitobacterium aromaticivorans]
MSLVYSAFVPHPPILLPEIGRGQEQICARTLAAYRDLAQIILTSGAECVVIVSPHAQLLEQGFTFLNPDSLVGDFLPFGIPALELSFPNEPELIKKIAVLPGVRPSVGRLDHGALVPLYFLHEAGWRGPVVVLGMPLEQAEDFGIKVGNILRAYPKACALVASGDLSHRLREDGPYGFDPAGPEFDRAIVTALRRDAAQVKAISPELAERAGECGFRSLRFALAAQEGAVKVLSYEGPFGVGYLVAELYRSSMLAKWARSCLIHYLEGRNVKDLELPPETEFKVRRGCFVTLKKNGELRGCIGTTQGWQDNLALEIKHNACAAGTEDPRFWPVEKGELQEITFSVDVLGELERVRETEELDPWRYGVVVKARGRSGLLLPHLEGVNTVEEQIGIAKQKAGLAPGEPVEMWRFEVERHYE